MQTLQLLTEGDSVTLTATVDTETGGYVEFIDGDRVLDHDELEDKVATLETTDLRLDARELTARYVPLTSRHAAPSVSPPAAITVVEEDGADQFGTHNWKNSYPAGEDVELSLRGVTLGENESVRWISQASTSSSQEYVSLGETFGPRGISTLWNGVQIKLSIFDSEARETVQETESHTIAVVGEDAGNGEEITLSGLEDSYFVGGPFTVTKHHAPLEEGQVVRFAMRHLPHSTEFQFGELWEAEVSGDEVSISPSFLNTSWSGTQSAEGVLQIVDADGTTVIGQTAPFAPTIMQRELAMEGAQEIYRVGQQISLTAQVDPTRDGLDYQWGYGASEYQFEQLEGEDGPALALPVVADVHGRTIGLHVTDSSTGDTVRFTSMALRVVDVAEGEQALLIAGLGAHGGHYHQSTTIDLDALADPLPADTDTFRCEWKRQYQAEWTVMEGATTAHHEVVAEQALDGTVVRATLLDENGAELATSPEATILVDDHGAAARQQVQITGSEESYAAGEDIVLTASVAPESVLSRYAWEVVDAGGESCVIEHDGTAQLVLPATEDLDGGTISAALVFDDGSMYVRSEPVPLTVPPGGPRESG